MNAFVLSTLLIMLIAILGSLVLLPQRHRARCRQRRIETLRLLSALRSLIGHLQQHRGASNGYLCGATRMAGEVERLRGKIAQDIGTCDQFTDVLRHQARWESFCEHWARLGTQVMKLPVANNLQQHNLLIANLLYLLEDLAETRELSDPAIMGRTLPYVWRELLQTAEWVGQARALGTGMAAAGASTSAERIRMRFLRDRILALSQESFARLRDHGASDTWLDMPVAEAEQAVQRLLTDIEQALLASETPAVGATDYFQRATRTIDALLGIVDQVLQRLPARV